MNSISKGKLLDIIAICSTLLLFTNLGAYKILYSVLIIYGFITIILYLIHLDNLHGESKTIDLILGIIKLIGGFTLLSLHNLFGDYYKHIILFICLLHGIGRMFINSHRGLILKLAQIGVGILFIAYAVLSLDFLHIGFLGDFKTSLYVMLGIVFLDIIILVLSRILPRNDLENDDVSIKYGSEEDRIMMEYKSKIKRDEVIDIDKLFKNEGEEV
ncbi:MAG: hypothetical protein IJS58_06445 [Bacilli bacterium]|nr:hypothetical protein [Bacilli bacterium]